MGTILVFIISAVILFTGRELDQEWSYNHSSLEETENIN